jgi:3-hydroxyacyl-CoA dehydrogenase/enoyl-CoA hydratase/3-hydroxybutyryl-CoA epimerase
MLGIGFPPFLGGPFRWIDQIGADALVGMLRRCAEGTRCDTTEHFEPAEGLLAMARSGGKYHQT